jgi:glucose/arabinose dehydrogenase
MPTIKCRTAVARLLAGWLAAVAIGLGGGAGDLADAKGLAATTLTTTRVAAGLEFPVFAGAPAGDAERVFILEQNGRILILKDGALLAQPFLDIDALVPDVSISDERGLLGLAFHPEYATSGYFYLDYTDLSGNTVIARYTVSGDPDRADPGSAAILLTIKQPFGNHNGGTLAFGPLDGFLYIGMGDGGSSGDPGDRAQDDGTLLGKMLRIDVDTGEPYGIPPDNPFAGPGDPLDEIWAKGLRNPYRWSFDRQTGDLYIADVGQGAWEEVDFQPAASAGGQNYGWRLMEGSHCFNPPVDCNDGSLTLPIHEYGHDLGCSITGGCVYRGQAIGGLQGSYFFGDYCSGRIWTLRVAGGQATELFERTAELAPESGQFIDNVVAFGEDGQGELYIVDRGIGSDGEIYKIVPAAPQTTAPSSWGRLKGAYR